jgi:hypothetical protein
VIDVGLTGEAGFASSAARAQGRTMPPSPTRAFSVDLGDLVAPDRPVAGAGRLASSEEIHEYSFPVRAGQSWYLAAAPSCDVEGLRWSLVGPDGSPIRDALGGTDEPLCVDLGRFTADEDGSYTVRVRAAEGTPAGGEFGFVLTPVRPDIRATITIGDSVSTDDPVPGAGRLEVPGAIHRYSFNASAGDVIYLRTAGCAQGILVWRLFGPDGRPLPTYRQQTCLDLGRMDISVAGTYTVVVGEGGPATGSYGFALLRVGPDGAFAIQPGDIIAEGRPGQGAGRIETPGSLDRYAFSAEAGDLITVANLATGTASCSGLRWDLLDPNGSPLYVDQILCAGAERPAIAAPTSGIYVLRVRGAGASVGTYGMRVVTTH